MRFAKGLRVIAGLVIGAWGGFAQEPLTPAFEVASVKLAGPPTEATFRLSLLGLRVAPPYVRLSFTNLFGLIQTAYGVTARQIEGQPAWMEKDPPAFDIEAKLPDGASPQQIPLMFQKLLAERFGLSVHRRMIEEDVYVLAVAPGGPKFAKAGGQSQTIEQGQEKQGSNVTQIGGARITRKDGYTFVEAEKMSDLVRYIRPRLGLGVIDKTGLDGSYVIEMQVMNLAPPLVVAGQPAAYGSVADLIFPAVERLGLKLVRQKSPVEIIVIDHAEKFPTQN